MHRAKAREHTTAVCENKAKLATAGEARGSGVHECMSTLNDTKGFCRVYASVAVPDKHTLPSHGKLQPKQVKNSTAWRQKQPLPDLVKQSS